MARFKNNKAVGYLKKKGNELFLNAKDKRIKVIYDPNKCEVFQDSEIEFHEINNGELIRSYADGLKGETLKARCISMLIEF